jgi:hypothetical protein
VAPLQILYLEEKQQTKEKEEQEMIEEEEKEVEEVESEVVESIALLQELGAAERGRISAGIYL